MHKNTAHEPAFQRVKTHLRERLKKRQNAKMTGGLAWVQRKGCMQRIYCTLERVLPGGAPNAAGQASIDFLP